MTAQQKIDMKRLFLVCLTILLLGLMANGSVWAHGRYNFGFNLGYYDPGYYSHFGYGSYGYGDPFFYPPMHMYPPYYPPTVIVPSAPPVYIQSEETRPAQQRTYYWYYCRNPEGYYPYIQQCPEGWLQVAPQPSNK